MHFGIKTVVVLSASIFGWNNLAKAESFFSPSLCETSQASLIAKNISNKPQAFWIQLKNPEREVRFEINSQVQIQIPSIAFLDSAQAFSIRTWTDGNIQFTWQCENLKTRLTSQISPSLEYKVLNKTHYELNIMNVSPLANEIELRFLNFDRQTIASKKITLQKYYETQMLEIETPANTVYLQIQGMARLHSWLQFQSQILTASVVFRAQLSPPTQKSYFLASTRPSTSNKNDESFVVSIEESQMIEQARQQIANPNLEKIMVGRIGPGNGGYNRSFHEKDRSPYSWSVTDVDSFTDFALNDCDGTPDYVEGQLLQRLDEGGRICFWRYRILRELSWSEVQRGY